MRPALVAAALAACVPMAAGARECSVDLGRGWPPAVGNYGAAAERLFDGGRAPALSLLTLPARGVESGLSLWPGQGAGNWTLRYSRADERIHSWVGAGARGGVQLRTEQTPEAHEIPIPAALGQRLVQAWGAALGRVTPAERNAPLVEGEILSFVVEGVRYSGTRPGCGAGELLMRQAALLIEASEGKEKKREKRWNEIESSLDELQQTLAGTAG